MYYLFITYSSLKQNIVTEAIIGDSVAYIFRAFDVVKEQEGKSDPDMEVADYQLHYGKVFKVSKTEVGVRLQDQDQEEWYFSYDEYRLGRELMQSMVVTGETIQFIGMLSSRRNKKRKVNDSVGDCDPTGVVK